MPCSRVRALLLLSVIYALAFPVFAQTQGTGNPEAKEPAPTISLSVDATEAPRSKIFHARMVIPVSGKELTLYYPKWIPGEHAPDGPLVDTAGITFTANGQRLLWRRDLLDMYTIHVNLLEGVKSVDATLDYLSPAAAGGFSAGSSATAQLSVISWNQVLLYPKGWTSDQITYQANLRLPSGWQFGTSLPVESQNGNEIHFKPVSLEMLVDSPVITGAYYRKVDLAAGQAIPHEMDIAADSAAALDAPAEVVDHYKNLVTQAYALFGARHYRDYHFLLSLSDHVAHFGLEHHESDDSRVGERGLTDEEERKLDASLLPHEYVHSWNGKYRRPADLTTPDYQQPMQTDLLWVYEGLTSYLGNVLAARSGLWTPDQFKDQLALIAAELEFRPGRTWRNLQDTADAAPGLYFSSSQWESWRRTTDFYDEDVLNWLWADVIIRHETQGRKSLDDFCKFFHGGQNTPPIVKTYTYTDILNGLTKQAIYDWPRFWALRLRAWAPHAPLGGIEGSGWKLVFNETESDMARAEEHVNKGIDARYSVGLLLRDAGTVVDAIPGMAAAQAGIGPAMKVVAVNSRAFSTEVWHDAMKATKKSSGPLELLVENTEYYKTYSLNYHDGEKYPHLERDPSTPDLLGEIVKPVAAK